MSNVRQEGIKPLVISCTAMRTGKMKNEMIVIEKCLAPFCYLFCVGGSLLTLFGTIELTKQVIGYLSSIQSNGFLDLTPVAIWSTGIIAAELLIYTGINAACNSLLGKEFMEKVT